MKRESFSERHPVVAIFAAPWVAVGLAILVVLPFVLMWAAIFGLLLLGDELGLYDFDSGLGSEAGGR